MDRTTMRMLVALLGTLAWGCDGPAEAVDGGRDAGRQRPADAGTDAGPVITVDCSTALDDGFYDPPARLPAYGPAERGRLVRCATGPALEVATVRERARRPIELDPGEPDNYAGPELPSGATLTMIGYRTERLDGSGAYATGALYLPDGGGTDLPLLVHVAGTTGAADVCAPSRGRFTDLERTLYVLLGRGHAVLVPDLVGLGTPGTYAYLEPNEAAHSVLDGARAALAAAPDALSGQVFVSGHSAGGHAALSAQALQPTYAPELDLAAVAGVAPAWFDLSVFRTAFLQPTYSTDPAVNGNAALFATMFYVGYAAAYDGEEAAWQPIRAGIRDSMQEALSVSCIQTTAGEAPSSTARIHALAPTLNDLFEGSFRMSIRSCFFVGCDAVGMEWEERFDASRPPLATDGAPVWFHVGTADATVTLDLIRGTIAEAGIGTACCYRDATHNTVAGLSAPWIADWVSALAAGGDGPACPDRTLEECLAPPDDGGMGDPDAGATASDAGVATDAGMDGGVP